LGRGPRRPGGDPGVRVGTQASGQGSHHHYEGPRQSGRGNPAPLPFPQPRKDPGVRVRLPLPPQPPPLPPLGSPHEGPRHPGAGHLPPCTPRGRCPKLAAPTSPPLPHPHGTQASGTMGGTRADGSCPTPDLHSPPRAQIYPPRAQIYPLRAHIYPLRTPFFPLGPNFTPPGPRFIPSGLGFTPQSPDLPPRAKIYSMGPRFLT